MIVCSAADEPTTPVADVILPHRLIGNEAAAHSREYLRERNVAAIVNVAPTENSSFGVGSAAALLQIPVLDTSTAELYVHFEAAIAFIRQQRNERCVLVQHEHVAIRRLAHLMHTFAAAGRLAADSPLTHPNGGLGRRAFFGPGSEYTREAHTVWNGKNRGPCAVDLCCCPDRKRIHTQKIITPNRLSSQSRCRGCGRARAASPRAPPRRRRGGSRRPPRASRCRWGPCRRGGARARDRVEGGERRVVGVSAGRYTLLASSRGRSTLVRAFGTQPAYATPPAAAPPAASAARAAPPATVSGPPPKSVM